MSRKAEDDLELDERERAEILGDPFVRETIENTLAPYEGVAPPALLAAMRATLEEAMVSHPYAIGILRALRRPGRVPDASGEQPRATVEGGEVGQGEAPKGGRAGGERR